MYVGKQIEISAIQKNIVMDKPNLGEFEGVMFLNCFDKLPTHCYEDRNIQRYQKINMEIDEIIKNMHMEDSLDWDKLIKIVNYIVTHIQYDEQVKQRIGSGYTGMDSRVIYYNDYPLSSVLEENQNLEVEGICINYADLMTVLCQKVGIPVYSMSGFSNFGYGAHAWNLISLDKEYAYIDLTSDDSNEMFHTYLESYLLSEDA